jgi:hypothetical protein
VPITFTYDPGNPGLSTVTTLRYMVGDVGPDPWYLTDQEITLQYSLSGGIYRAASDLCYALAARFATQVSSTLASAGISESTSDQHKHYLALAGKYADMAAAAGEGTAGGGGSTAVIAAPFVGGVDAGEMNDVDRDINRPLPAFSSSERYPWPYSTWRP